MSSVHQAQWFCLTCPLWLQLPKRAAQDPYDAEYTEWDEESEPQNAGQEDDIQV